MAPTGDDIFMTPRVEDADDNSGSSGLRRRHSTFRAGRLNECVRHEASVPIPDDRFLLNLDGKSGDEVISPSCVHVAERSSEPALTPMEISFDDTTLDPGDRQALTAGIKSPLKRLHTNLGHPTNDDMVRCLNAGGGTHVAQRAAMLNM